LRCGHSKNRRKFGGKGERGLDGELRFYPCRIIEEDISRERKKASQKGGKKEKKIGLVIELPPSPDKEGGIREGRKREATDAGFGAASHAAREKGEGEGKERRVL